MRLAAKYAVNSTDILATNGLDDPNLVVGQVLVVPGAKGKAIAEPDAQAGGQADTEQRRTEEQRRRQQHPAARPRIRAAPSLWPVVGGGNYISQYFHYGHYAIDIAADYGSTVRAAAAGTVIFAGWKSNGGGYQVWIAHGSGLYTTYNHMSAIAVGRGPARRSGRSTSVASASPATPPVRTPLRGLARPGLGRRPAGQPARVLLARTSRRRPVLGPARHGPGRLPGRPVREWPRCSSTA